MHNIICIGRQSGSNGRLIARKTAEKLGIACYDRELLEKAVQTSGISKELIENADEKVANPFLYTTLYSGSSNEYFGKNANDILFLAQRQIILDIASKEDCVFVGRCADDILRKKGGCGLLCAFITASMEYRIKTVMTRDGLSEKAAADYVRKVDRSRKAYYDFYTDNDWGKPSDYDVTLNASSLGEDRIVDTLAYLYREMGTPSDK